MNKLYRILSTVLMAVGFIFIFYHIVNRMGGSASVLNNPSFYNHNISLYIFIFGIIVLVFGLLGSFFAWHKSLEPQEEILPNAGFSDKENIATWLEGSTLDTVATETKTVVDGAGAEDKTEVLGADDAEDKTEVLGADDAEDKTEVLGANDAEDKTEVLGSDDAEDETEVLGSDDAEDKTEVLGSDNAEGKTEVLVEEKQAEDKEGENA